LAFQCISAVSNGRWRGAEKSLSEHAALQAAPAAIRSGAECTRQYEILRGLALEAGENSNGNALELAYLECRGLAAWMAYVPPGPAPGAAPVGLQTADVESPGCDLILSLANLVLGDRLEAQNE
jgi:hypothetical protein